MFHGSKRIAVGGLCNLEGPDGEEGSVTHTVDARRKEKTNTHIHSLTGLGLGLGLG